MDKININSIINREKEEKIVINFIENFTNDSNKRGLYIYGNNGSGKTTFIMNILKSRGYDVILYNSLNIRNKSVIETVTKNNMINKNVFSLFKKQNKKQVIVMDEIDAMLNNDKGGILSLIKLLKIKRGKKTQKDIFLNPLICISNKSQDKKIYLLYKNNQFHLQTTNNDDYIITSYTKQPSKNMYIAQTKSGKQMKILLRWKNGNGIAYPAFQIS